MTIRQLFAQKIHKLMTENEDVYFITGDLGMFILDDIKRDFPDRFINVGAAEQSMMDIAVGIASTSVWRDGYLYPRKVITYTITPFYLRGFETIRTYINHEKHPILMAGSGIDKDYAHDGFSHDATDIPQFFAPLKNIKVSKPESEEQLQEDIDEWLKGKPSLILLRK